VFIVPVLEKAVSLNRDYFALTRNPSIERAEYINISKNLQDTVLYVQTVTSKDDAIYIGVKNHDQFIANDAIIYFLANREYATRYHELHPGVANTPNIQEEIITEISEAPAKIIVLVSRPSDEPNESKIDTGTDLLDNYIVTNYEMVEAFGKYEVWLEKDFSNSP
jgi:hypothetical protein